MQWNIIIILCKTLDTALDYKIQIRISRSYSVITESLSKCTLGYTLSIELFSIKLYMAKTDDVAAYSFFYCLLN